jgi:hypothetical protein
MRPDQMQHRLGASTVWTILPARWRRSGTQAVGSLVAAVLRAQANGVLAVDFSMDRPPGVPEGGCMCCSGSKSRPAGAMCSVSHRVRWGSPAVAANRLPHRNVAQPIIRRAYEVSIWAGEPGAGDAPHGQGGELAERDDDHRRLRFPSDVIVVAVRLYLRFGLSYRDVEERERVDRHRSDRASITWNRWSRGPGTAADYGRSRQGLRDPRPRAIALRLARPTRIRSVSGTPRSGTG